MIAFLFPGQGSQHPGMGRDLAERDPIARASMDEIDEALGFPLSRTCAEGTAEELALTETTQPAVLACSVAAWRSLDARGVRADYVAGHSLGEYSALVAAGALTATDAARTVRRRGRYMQEAVPPGIGAMAAFIGMEQQVVEESCLAATRDGEIVTPANFNAPGQIVVAGHRAAVERAIEEAKARGGRRCVMLPVSAPFHCRLMEPAAARLGPDLAALTFAPLVMPLVANVTARENSDAMVARDLLAQQVTAPVRWQESIERLVELGVDTLVEVGPGRVLAGLVKRIAPSARMLSVSTADELDAACSVLT